MGEIIKFDFDTILTKLQEKIALKGTWSDNYVASTSSFLLEIVAAGNENLGYYLEREIQELFMPIARTREGIKHLGALLGYDALRETAAIGTMTLDMSANPPTSNIILSKGTTIYIDEDTPVCIVEDVVILAGAITQTLDVYQGEYQRIEYALNSLGDLAAHVMFYDDGKVKNITVVDDNDASVDIDGISENFFKVYATQPSNETVEYAAGDSIFSILSPTDRYYLSRSFYGKFRLVFGDGVSGANPSSELTTSPKVIIEYLKTLGENGNIVSSITDLEFHVAVSGLTEYNLTLNSLTGGAAAEDASSIKTNAPRLYSTGNRAVRDEDYIYFLEQNTNIEKALAWGEQEEINNGIDWQGARNKARLIVLKDAFADINDVYTGVVIGVADGSTSIYAITVANTPLVEKAVDIKYTIGATEYIASDDGVGTITGQSLTGTVDYASGTIALIFSITPDTASSITVDYKDKTIINNILTTLGQKMGMTIQAEYIDPYVNDYVHLIDLIINLAISEGYTFASVSAAVRAAIDSNFGISFFKFGKPVYKSDFIKVILDIEGVNGCTVTWTIDEIAVSDDVWDPLELTSIIAEILSVGDGTTLTFAGTTTQALVKQSSVIVKYTVGGQIYFAFDDKKGNLLGTYLSSGTINYETGVVALIFSNAIDVATNITIDYDYNTNQYERPFAHIAKLEDITQATL